MSEPQYLYGLHDAGGEHLLRDKPGWVVISAAIGADPSDGEGGDYRALADQGLGVIVRLNHAHNGVDGTVPPPEQYTAFALRAAAFVANSHGCTRWIIGNEPNHAQERPHGRPIPATDYASVFNLCAQRIHRATRGTDGGHQVLLAAIAPWNESTGDWLEYFRTVLASTARFLDGLALHTYTHGADPGLITAETRLRAPYQDRCFDFRSYRDFLAAVPVSLRHLPVYITETNPNGPWPAANTGWVQAAYAEIDAWNADPFTQKIFCLCLYRWSAADAWRIDDKPGIQADLAAALAHGYRVPQPLAATAPPLRSLATYLPNLQTMGAGKPENSVMRVWDMRLSDRGVKIVPATASAAGPSWRVVVGRWLDENEAGGRHHLLVDVVDEAGQRVVDVPLRVKWPDGETEIRTQAKPGEPYAADFPLSPSRNEFAIRVDDGTPSETVIGLGMGALTPAGYNPGIHTSTVLRFQRVAAAVAAPAPTPSPTPSLVHPLAIPAPISQRFGEHPQDYAAFGLAGHNGVDYGVATGTPVRAAAAGKVVEAGDDAAGYGQYVKLDHGWGETLYAHLSVIQVANGEQVVAGQPLGLSGATGNSSGPHLHFGLRLRPYTRGAPYDGYVDPLPHLGAAAPRQMVRAALRQAADEFQVDFALLAALAWAESSWDAGAVSAAGAQGVMQFMPATWAEWGARVGVSDPFDPTGSVRAGAAYWRYLLKYFANNERKALWAWNFGVGQVGAGKTPPAATLEFATKILMARDLIRALGVGS